MFAHGLDGNNRTYLGPDRRGKGVGTDTGELDWAVHAFLTQRTQLFRIAHRVTGDTAAAEDVLQEAWIRWQRTDRNTIKNPAAFLTTTTTHLAINVIQSARHRREAPTESVADAAPTALVDADEDPVVGFEQAAVVEDSLQTLMTRLNPAELAAYVLRKAFDYPYADVAHLLTTSSANARQLVRRAQQHLEIGRERQVDSGDHQRLVLAFRTAARTGDLVPLEGELTRLARHPSRRHPRQRVGEVHRCATARVA